MKKAEAEREVVREWDRWWAEQSASPDRKATGTDGLLFFSHLQNQQSHLLTFKSGGDKWQTVHAWLLHARRVVD